MIELKKAEPRDCGAIHAMQVEAFAELLEKYGDTATNPGAEPLERIEARMAQDATDYYLILAEGRQIGAARVQRLPENVCRVSPIFYPSRVSGEGIRAGGHGGAGGDVSSCGGMAAGYHQGRGKAVPSV